LERYFHSVSSSQWLPVSSSPGVFAAVGDDPGLRHSPTTEPENCRNEKCKQGCYEYDLRASERSPSDDAEAESGSDQGDDKKGNRPAKHDVLLTLRWLLLRVNSKAAGVFQ
jgi:hypothetical protein